MSPRLTKAQRDRQLARDARNRALRSFLQGLGIDVLVAIAAVAITVASADVDAWQGWSAVGVSLSRSVVQAAASYVMRRFVDGWKHVPTPLPPAEAGEPDDDTG